MVPARPVAELRALRRRAAALAATLAWLPAPAFAGVEDDALNLADRSETSAAAPASGAWTPLVEVTASQTSDPSGQRTRQSRASIDLRYDARYGQTLRLVASNRLDLPLHDGSNPLNAWREGYLAWQPDTQQTLSLGRRIWRQGVALDYNPSDFLRGGAFRLDAGINPFDVETLRLGVFGLGYQRLWSGGHLTLVHAPHIGTQRSDAALALDSAATNATRRTLVGWSQRLNDSLSPQLLWLAEQGRRPRAALNLTLLAAPSTVLQLELAQGSETLLPLPSQGGAGSAGPNRLRGSAGFTHTATDRLTLWAVLHHSGTAPDRAQWQQFSTSSTPYQWAEYHALAELRQELPARDAVSLGGAWRGFLVKPLQLRGFVMAEATSHSAAWWLEAAWLGQHADLVARANLQTGSALSVYGSSPRHSFFSLALRLPIP